MAKKIADRAIQVLGGNGYVAEYKVTHTHTVHSLIHMSILTHTHKHKHTHTHTNISTHTHTCILIHSRTDTHVQTQTHTNTP